MPADRIHVEGLREFQRRLRTMDAMLPRQLRLALNEAGAVIVDYAAPRFPRDTGAAARSLRARSSQRYAKVALGGARVPYAPWLDFGGTAGRGKGVKRPFVKSGRYVYAGLRAEHDKITQIMTDALAQLARDAGLEVT